MTAVNWFIAFTLIAIGWPVINALLAEQDRTVEGVGRTEQASPATLPASPVILNRIHETCWEMVPARSMLNPPR